MKSLKQAAIDYANNGWSVFPLVPNDKMPLIPKDEAKAIARGFTEGGHGCRDGTCDIGKVWDWWTKSPNANIGIATGPASGILVVDIDSADAGVRYREMGDVGRPLIQDTRDGYHLAYAWTEECAGISISAGKLGEGIDTRGEGGYIVGAPSIHPSGHIYQWRDDYDPSPPPKWLVRKLKPPKPLARREVDRALFERPDDRASRYGIAALKHSCEDIAAAMNGTRERTLHKKSFSIGRLVAGGEISESYALDLLVSAALCMDSDGVKSPFTAEYFEKKIKKSMDRGRDYPRNAGTPK